MQKSPLTYKRGFTRNLIGAMWASPSTFVNGAFAGDDAHIVPQGKLYLEEIYSSIALAAVLPAPIARITVAAPVTASPPA